MGRSQSFKVRLHRTIVLAVTVCVAAAAAQQAAAPSGTVIADFDQIAGSAKKAGNFQLQLVPGGEDGSNKYLRITALGGGALGGHVIFALPEDVSAGRAGGVAARVRVIGEGRAVLRWVAVDAQNRIIFGRKLELDPSDEPQDVVLPWTRWRWGEPFGGSPSDIRRHGFRIDELPVTEVRLDDLRLIAPPGEGGVETPKDWLLRVAFAGRDIRVAEADGLLVATDVPDQLTEADLTRILSRMRALRSATRRLFGDAVHQVEGLTPPSLLIFRGQGAFIRFFEAVGKEWNVRIIPLPLPGMTVQNIGSAVFDPKQGAERPVFLHESVHVVLANDLRMNCNALPHSWLQEGMAAYVQACAYPELVARRKFAEAFAQPPGAEGASFKPLAELFRRRVDPPEYSQLASLLAYLVTEKPQWLPTVAAELVAGRTAEQAFRKCGTTVPQVEEAWAKWGRARFVDGQAGDDAALPAPEEFRSLRSR
jgi:hypothetical protein